MVADTKPGSVWGKVLSSLPTMSAAAEATPRVPGRGGRKPGRAATTGTRGRAEREQAHGGAVDGRSARATGRTEQLNIKVRPDIKERARDLAEASGLTLAEWFERIVEGSQEAQP